MHTVVVPQVTANIYRINVTVIKKRGIKGQKIGIEVVKFWSHVGFELLFHEYERSNF